MMTTNFEFSISKLVVLFLVTFSATCLATPRQCMQTSLDQRARLLFGEKSGLSTFHHFANGNSYLYTLVYQSGLSVTFELSEKAIFVSKYSSESKGASAQSPKQSQSEITSYLSKLKEINDGYAIMFFAVLADGYLIQYQWQNTLYTYELSWDLEIRMKAIKDVILKNDAATMNMNSSASETSELEVKDEITSYLVKGGSFNLQDGTEIRNITKIGKTNRYLIDITTALNQRDLLYQMVVRKGVVGIEIIGGSYKIDFTPFYQQVTDLNQPLYETIDLLVRRKLNQLIPLSAKLSTISVDEPYYKLKYTITNTEYEVSCIYDSFLKRVNITNAAATSDVENSTDDYKNQKILTFNPAQTSGMVSRPGAQYTPYLPLSGPVFFPQFLSGMGTPIIRGSPQFLTNHPIVSGNLEESSNIIGKTTPKIEQAGQKAEETTKYSTSQVINSATLVSSNNPNIESASQTDTESFDSSSQTSQSVQNIENGVEQNVQPQLSSTPSLTSNLQATQPVEENTPLISESATNNEMLASGIDDTSTPSLLASSLGSPDSSNEQPIEQPQISENRTSYSESSETQSSGEQGSGEGPQNYTSSQEALQTNQSNQTVSWTADEATNSTSAQAPTENNFSAEATTTSLPIRLQVIIGLVPFSQQEFAGIITYLLSAVSSVNDSNANTYTIQKLEHGFRVIFIINEQYCEFIVAAFPYFKYKLVSMRNVTQEEAESVNSFSQMTKIDLDDDLQALVMKTLTKSKTPAIESISSTFLRLQADGLYYQMTIETGSGNSYLLTLYSEPEHNFSEVLSYEKVSSPFYMPAQNLTELSEESIDPTSKQSVSNDLVEVLDFVNKKFGANLTGAGVIYLRKVEIGEEGATRYRIGFQSASGVYYEVTVVFVGSSSPPILLKYMKLYDGYSLLPQNSSEAAAAIQFYQSSLQQQVEQANLSDFQIERVLTKDVQQIGTFYKLVLSPSQGFQVVVFVDLQGTMAIYGVDGIPDYYSTLLTLNYASYGNLITIIQNLRSAFAPPPLPTIPTLPIVSVSPPPPLPLLPQAIPAPPQILSSAPLINQSIPPPIPSLLPAFNFPSPFLSSFTSSSEAYDPRKDFYCLKSNGSQCITCFYRYFPKDGKCVAVPNECLTYNNFTGECLSCYMGYFLMNGSCAEMSILCMEADSKGNCIKCYNDYTLLSNQCYNSNGLESASTFNLSANQMDPLCEQYDGSACKSCTSGAYMSSKLGKCAIQDPNALAFDTANGVAVECVRGYTLSPEGKCTKTN